MPSRRSCVRPLDRVCLLYFIAGGFYKNYYEAAAKYAGGRSCFIKKLVPKDLAEICLADIYINSYSLIRILSGLSAESEVVSKLYREFFDLFINTGWSGVRNGVAVQDDMISSLHRIRP